MWPAPTESVLYGKNSDIFKCLGSEQGLVWLVLPAQKLHLTVGGPPGLLGRHNSLTSLEIIEGDVLSAMLRLITSTKHKSQLAGLQARHPDPTLVQHPSSCGLQLCAGRYPLLAPWQSLGSCNHRRSAPC